MAEDGDWSAAEGLRIDERLVVSPAPGVFQPLDARAPRVGDRIRLGQVVATVGGAPVGSPFVGHLKGWLALPGERVRRYQPIAWLAREV